MKKEFVTIESRDGVLLAVSPDIDEMKYVRHNSSGTVSLVDLLNALGASGWDVIPGIMIQGHGGTTLIMRRDKQP